MTKVLRIASRRDGFRRAGVNHPAAAQTYPLDRFTDEQRAQLDAEPMLLVDEIDAPKEAGAKDGGKKPAEDPPAATGGKKPADGGGKK